MSTKTKKVVSKHEVPKKEKTKVNMNKVKKELEDFINKNNTSKLPGEDIRPPYTVEMGNTYPEYHKNNLPEINSEEYRNYSKGQKAAYAYLKSVDSESLLRSRQYENIASKVIGNFDGKRAVVSDNVSYKEWLMKQVDDHMAWVRKQLESL